MRAQPELKTPEQLEREIAYYFARIQATTSSDRRQRVLRAIKVREQQLVEARRGAVAGRA